MTLRGDINVNKVCSLLDSKLISHCILNISVCSDKCAGNHKAKMGAHLIASFVLGVEMWGGDT